jgi:hypothetical protein
MEGLQETKSSVTVEKTLNIRLLLTQRKMDGSDGVENTLENF